MGHDVLDVRELEGEGPGGAVRFVRRRLGVRAFGVNWFELPPGAAGREHDARASGQEEVYVVVRGTGRMLVDGEEVALRPGVFVRVDPETDEVSAFSLPPGPNVNLNTAAFDGNGALWGWRRAVALSSPRSSP